jgi:hypothetical protein
MLRITAQCFACALKAYTIYAMLASLAHRPVSHIDALSVRVEKCGQYFGHSTMLYTCSISSARLNAQRKDGMRRRRVQETDSTLTGSPNNSQEYPQAFPVYKNISILKFNMRQS